MAYEAHIQVQIPFRDGTFISRQTDYVFCGHTLEEAHEALSGLVAEDQLYSCTLFNRDKPGILLEWDKEDGYPFPTLPELANMIGVFVGEDANG